MKKLLLVNKQSPGDIVVLTAAVRDLCAAHPKEFAVNVHTTAMELWDNNPYLDRTIQIGPGVSAINCHYPLVHHSNRLPVHFIQGFSNYLESVLKVRTPLTAFKGDIHLSEEEKNAKPMIEGKYWIMVAGCKHDYTCKLWPFEFYQAVVDHFKGKIRFAQCGEKHHIHKPLENVIDMLGKTTTREFIKLVYHAEGIVCPVTFAMHLAAAVPPKPNGPKLKPCVVISGGREPAAWEQYPGHVFLQNIGQLSCCATGGCWKSRCLLIGDKDKKDTENVCEHPVQIDEQIRVPKCMHMIKPVRVIEAIEGWYDGGVLQY